MWNRADPASPVITRAIDAKINQPEAYKKLRALLRKTIFDVTGGLKMQASDRHVGYVDNRSYRKALKRLCTMMDWQLDAPH